MALTIGTGPFGPNPSGHMDVDPPIRPLLFWETFPKRLRVVMGMETIADSRRVVALYETGQMMRLCVPWTDIWRDRLTEGIAEHSGRLGMVRQLSFAERVIARSI